MGMDADVICFGQKRILANSGCLDYQDNCYDDVADDTIVAGTVAVAHTTSESRLLAEICGVEPWDLGNHCITSIPTQISLRLFDDDMVGDESSEEIHTRLLGLLGSYPQPVVWFRPNG